MNIVSQCKAPQSDACVGDNSFVIKKFRHRNQKIQAIGRYKKHFVETGGIDHVLRSKDYHLKEQRQYAVFPRLLFFSEP